MYILVAFLVLAVSSVFSQPVTHYVKPEKFSSSCPGTPCLTLDQYTSQATTYFTAGATFLFLAGNHTINTSIALQNISDVAFRAVNGYSHCTLICKIHGVFVLTQVFNFTIEDLVFLVSNRRFKAIFEVLMSRSIQFYNMTFLGKMKAGAIQCSHAEVVIVRCLFIENTRPDGGGAISAFNSIVTLYSNVFSKNKFGAVAVSVSIAILDGNIFFMNEAIVGGAIYAENSSVLFREKLGNTFTCNFAKIDGGAMFISNSNFTIEETNDSKPASKDCIEACQNAGINCTNIEEQHLCESVLLLRPHTTVFFKNRAGTAGGAMFTDSSIACLNGTLVTFFENSAGHTGGAIQMQNSAVLLIGGRDVIFHRNSAQDDSTGLGGGIFCHHSAFTANSNNLCFSRNSASQGGAIYSMLSQCTMVSVDFRDNSGFGAGVRMFQTRAFFHNVKAAGNYEGAFLIFSSNASFLGHVEISKNAGKTGGGIWAGSSSIHFAGITVFEGNHAKHGGAIFMSGQSVVSFSRSVLFKNSLVNGSGGAIFATDSTLIISSDQVCFIGNHAEDSGGAMYFENGAKMTMGLNATLKFSINSATKYGGAIFYADAVTLVQCSVSMHKAAEGRSLPSCFIDFGKRRIITNTIYSQNNFAGLDGNFMFGGLLDKCEVAILEESNWENKTIWNIRYDVLFAMFWYEILRINDSQIEQITSQPYQLCFCKNIWDYSCIDEASVWAYRGRKFTVPLLALAQGEAITSSHIRVTSQPNVRLLSEQTYQLLPPNCTDLSFNMYSREEQEQLILYLDDSPCRDNGLARAVINVTFLPCPDGFTLAGDQCVCEKKLQSYSANCTIFDDGIYITRDTNAKFWMSPMNSSNGTYKGLILYPLCPRDYCKTDSVNITLSEPDVQCDHNRSGLLCGACATKYSLTFGSSTCETCSNTYLTLLLPFAAAGIALVFFLILLRLTVATGMINSVILYANILQANRNILFPSSHSTNILTVFIAWMNLDLGFSTCFYDGMDAYAQTWLQFAFPIYIWILMGLIIFTSRYSMTVTKLIGSNPIAVLATLLLMSYAKLLKIIIEVYSSVRLLYPEDKTVTVWLKDANIPYFQSWHLAITVVTTLLLVFLFLPYTLLLLLGCKLYYFMGRRRTRWLIKIRPLLDSYYAPCKIHTRYWTGFLLLVRCALYIVFSYNSLGRTAESLFAIIITFSALIAWPWLTVKIYSKSLTNAVEAVVYLNMVVLSSAALADINSPTLVLSLVSIVFCIMIGIIIYHFYILYMAKSEKWRRVLTKFTFRRKEENCLATESPATPLLNPAQPPQATRSFVTLREPLLTD